MRSENVVLGLLLAVLLLAGGAGWLITLQPELKAEPESLALLPQQLGGFEGTDLPIEATVESMLRADFNIQRAYVHSFGDVVWLYLGYYSTERGGTPEHTPDVCYWANGWQVVQDRRVAILGSEEPRAREFIVEQAGHQRLVLFWYRSYRNEVIPSTLWLNWDHFAGRIRGGRADGGLVRLSTPMPDGNIDEARARLNRFAAVLDPELDALWPTEAVR